MKLLVLDFDGVVNVERDREALPWTESTGWVKHRREHLIPTRNNPHKSKYLIHYTPDCIDWLNNLVSRGVNLVILSTWRADSTLFDKLGLTTDRTFIDFPDSDDLWLSKGEALANYLKNVSEDSKIAWVDDELAESPQCLRFAESNNIHTVSPIPAHGLTRGLADELERFFFD